MNRLRILLLVPLLVADSLQHGRCDPARSSYEHNGFVSLLQWAKENEFTPTWLKHDGLLTLTSKSASLAFKTDSKLAEINGIHVWLCDAVVFRDGQPCISSLDLRATLEPILFRQTNELITSICLDPGHGGKDTGAAFGRYQEKEYTLPLAREVAAQLEAAGFKVMLTRTDDRFVELENRPALANRRRASLFISLHFNIAAPGEARGVEVYCLTPAKSNSTNARGTQVDTGSLPGNRQDSQNVLLAYQLQKSLVNTWGAEDRGLRRARFEVLRSAEMPAVLIEGGFLSDPLERERIADPRQRSQLAAAIVQGVLDYQHTVKP